MYEHLHRARKTDVPVGEDIYDKATQFKGTKSTRSRKSDSGDTSGTSTPTESSPRQTLGENPPSQGIPSESRDKPAEEMKEGDTSGMYTCADTGTMSRYIFYSTTCVLPINVLLCCRSNIRRYIT